FERMLRADNDIERQQFEKLFARDVKSHVDAISSKYIRPDEGTYDFAFMYLPSEAIYYELACGRTGALLTYAHEKRVLPVSPTTRLRRVRRNIDEALGPRWTPRGRAAFRQTLLARNGATPRCPRRAPGPGAA